MLLVWVVAAADRLAAQSADVDPALRGQLRERFERAERLRGEGHLEEALLLYNGILELDPAARGSLMFSGLVLLDLGRPAEARTRLGQFLLLEPDHSPGIIGMIKASQAAGDMEEVDRWRTRLGRLRGTGRDARLDAMISYERERVRVEGGILSVQERFATGPGQPLWVYLVVDENKRVIRSLEYSRMPESQEQIFRQSRPEWRQEELYVIGESEVDGSGYKVHDFGPGPSNYAAIRDRVRGLLR